MFRLAHLSDIHLGPMPEVKFHSLLNKRITGYVNWQRNRAKHIGTHTLQDLTHDLLKQEPDHIALSGDLVNLALDVEIERARIWLEGFGAPDKVSVVPGNHDAYVPGALNKVCRAWGPWMRGDNAPMPHDSTCFPYLRKRGPIALIGLSSARASAPLMATGYFRQSQANALAQILRDTKEYCRVIMIHHPPARGVAPSHKRLFGISLFQNVIGNEGCDLVLHGHTHLPTVHWLTGPNGRDIPLVGVAAAGQGFGGHKPPANYNIFEFERQDDHWQVTQSIRAKQGANLPFETMSNGKLLR